MNGSKKGKNPTYTVLLWIDIAIAAAYLATAFSGYINPASCSYLALLGLAYPIALIATVLMIPVWLFIKKKYALIPIAALVLTIPQIFTFCPIHYNRFWGDRQESDFVLMTYNIFGLNGNKGKKSPHPSIAEILKYNPDFVCLQEMDDLHNKNKGITERQYDLLKQRYPYIKENPGPSGLSYFSKSPVQLVYSCHGSRYFSAEVYRTTIYGDSAFFVNTHLESIGLTKSDKELYMQLTSTDKDKTIKGIRSQLMSKLVNAFKNRAKQAENIRTVIDSIIANNPKSYIFVCGDFNDTPYSYAYLTVKGDLNDAYTDAGIGVINTYNANRFYFKIDQIFYDGNDLEAVSSRRGHARTSDHYPLITRFRKKDTNK